MITYIRHHFHPLWWLRRRRWFQRLQTLIDFPVQKQVDKIKVSVMWLRDLGYLLASNEAERKMMRCFGALLVDFKPAVFLDVGANVGIYSWTACNVSDPIDIWMFEPDEVNVRLLIQTIARNDLRRVTLHEAAVSDDDGILEFLVDKVSGKTGSLEDHGGNAESLHHAYGMSATRTVPSVRLDTFMEKLAGKRVLIKIDVEGVEDRVLRGARRILQEIRPVILIECYDLQKIKWVAELDYLIHDLREGANYLVFPAEWKGNGAEEWPSTRPGS